MHFLKFILPFSVFFLSLANCFSQDTYTSASDGDWNDVNTWTVLGLTPASNPGSDDNVIIDGHTVDCGPSYSECGTLTVSSSGVLNLEGTFGLWFLQHGTVTIDGTINGPGIIRVSRNVIFSGSGSINGDVELYVNNYTLTQDISSLSLSSATFTVNASFVLNSGNTITINGQFTKRLSNISEITNNGTFIINTNEFLGSSSVKKTSDVFNSSNGDIHLNYNGNFPNDKYNSFKNISILGGDITSTSDFSVNGNWLNNAIFSSTSGNTITFNGSSPSSITGIGTNNFYNVLLNKTSGGLTLGDGSVNKPNINIYDVMETSSGDFTQDGAAVVLKSNSSENGMIVVGSSSNYSHTSGMFTSELFYNASSNGYRMVCSPIKSSTLSELDDEYIFCGISGAASPGNNFTHAGCGFYNVQTYNPSLAEYVDVINISQSISNGIGTLIYTSSGTTNLSMTNSGSNDPCFTDVTISGQSGYNLVSNPYPANLDFSSLRTASGTSDFTDDYWIFSGDAGNYINKTTIGSSIIAQNQGFFVQLSDNKDIKFSVNQTTKATSNFQKSVNGINFPLSVMVSSNQNSYYDYAHLVAAPEYSIDYDSTQESPKFYTPYPDYAPNIYFLDNQSNDLHKMSINNNQSADLFFDVIAGTLAHGNHKLSFINIDKFMIGSCIELEDLHNGVITDLRTDSIYTFSSDSTAPVPRFKLSIDVNYDIIVSNLSCFEDSSASISLSGSSINGSNFILSDSNGVIIDSILATLDSIYFSNLDAGIHTISTDHGGSCSLVNQEIIIVQPNEIVAEFSIFNDTIYLDSNGISSLYFKNISTGASHYIWNFGDGNYSSEISPTHNFLNQGTYMVTLTADNDSVGVCSKSYQVPINVIDINNLSNVPNSNNITQPNIYFTNYNQSIIIDNLSKVFSEVYIHDITGRLVYKSEFKNLIDVKDFSNGIYIINLKNNKDNYTQKLYISERN